MSHPAQREFCLSVRDKYPSHFTGKNVLDCGSLDINGNNRHLFTYCKYTGIDIGPGKNVDIVTTIHEFNYPDSSYDTIISTECFEHDRFYGKSLANIVRLLKPGGLFLFTCATTGRPEHGTQRTLPGDSPLTSAISSWSNYYKNLEEHDIRVALTVDNVFSEYNFSVIPSPHDLYFWGIKKPAEANLP